MLKGINALLNADVLYALRAMGHGDDLIIADTNFPSDGVARETVLGELLRIDASAAEVVRAVFYVCQTKPHTSLSKVILLAGRAFEVSRPGASVPSRC